MLRQLQVVLFGLLCALPTRADIQEPVCSQFDYQQRLLEKIIRLENKLTLVEQRLTEKTDLIAFSTSLHASLRGLKHEQTVVYDHVETNVGLGYNKHTGQFTCPRSGTYMFSLTTMTMHDQHIQLDLLLNGVNVMSSISHGIGWNQASITKVFRLSQGDALWVKVRSSSKGNSLYADSYSAFTGFLIHS